MPPLSPCPYLLELTRFCLRHFLSPVHTARRSAIPGPEEGEDRFGGGLNAKQCEQAVRTCFMQAMLQSDEGDRLER
jgi:hypothetical protein